MDEYTRVLKHSKELSVRMAWHDSKLEYKLINIYTGNKIR